MLLSEFDRRKHRDCLKFLTSGDKSGLHGALAMTVTGGALVMTVTGADAGVTTKKPCGGVALMGLLLLQPSPALPAPAVMSPTLALPLPGCGSLTTRDTT
eukprot:CAMPEP_0172821786 /NCGR_PEP_ID=MMETSP1075-20121228/16215_1 /TAXON_ID=2916 /ORGANISM="Ceratium fusus, Strain PA161109" /LENGTH=99 /DNA_ID=CAMNT_0013662691 /DNA_START=196 /DNA_END=491 /DNA_ORIENTATION=-